MGCWILSDAAAEDADGIWCVSCYKIDRMSRCRNGTCTRRDIIFAMEMRVFIDLFCFLVYGKDD